MNSLVLRILSSKWLTVYLMLVSAVVMAVITVAEAVEDTSRTPYRLYLSWWFTGLLWIVWINLACSAIQKSWWTAKRIPGSLMHVGFLLILTGGFFTWQLGVRGDLPISENSSSGTFRVDRPVLQLTARTESGTEKRNFVLTDDGVFQPSGILDALNPFGSRSVDWDRLDTTVTVVGRMESSRIDESVVEAPAGTGRAALVLDLESDKTRQVLLRDGEVFDVGMDALSSIRFAAAGERTDDLVRATFGQWIEIKPPEGRSTFFPFEVPGDLGRSVKEGDYTITVLEYHPNFKVGREPDPDDPPLNPAVELTVSGPCGSKTLHSFAQVEFHGNRFDDGTTVHFHRPADAATLLLLHDGAGAVEAWQGADQEPVVLTADRPLELGGGALRVKLHTFFAGSRIERKIVPDETKKGPPAFSVRIGDDESPAWICADSAPVLSADGRIGASIGSTLPLGFELHLDDAVAEYWPASGIPKAYYSFVTIRQNAAAQPWPARIETNSPLLQNRFRLYQSGMDQEHPYRYSIFAVARDPGLPYVTIGFLAMIAGLLWLYANRFVRAPLRRRRLKGGSES